MPPGWLEALAFYWRVGRRATPKHEAEHGPTKHPYWARVAVWSNPLRGRVHARQIGMAIGLATSYPMNDLLIRKGIEEAM